MIIKGQKGWVKIGETLYPITDMDINCIATVPLNITQRWYRSIAQSEYVASEYMYKAPPLDQGPPEMSDNDAFDLMDSIRKESPWQ